MASKALACGASPVVGNKASLGSGSPMCVGFGGRSSVKLPTSATSKGRSLVVRAELERQGSQGIPPINPVFVEARQIRSDLLETHHYVRAPWKHVEDTEKVVVSFDMPGVTEEDIEVNIIGDILQIDGPPDQVDATGKMAKYHAKLQLPANFVRNNAVGELRNGVLTITVPKALDFDLHRYRVPIVRY